MATPNNNFPGVRALVDVIGSLGDIDFNLMFRLLREGVTLEQLRRWYWERSDYLFLAPVHTVIDIARFTFTWRGRVLIARAFPDTSTLSAGDVVLIRRLPASTEYFTIIYVAQELIFYGVPKQLIARKHEAELWKFDGVTHTLVHTTALAPFDDMSVWITCVFWVPATGLLYFTTLAEDASVTAIDSVKLWKFDIATNLVAQIPVLFDSDSGFGDVSMPPIFDAAFFNGDIYLVQGGVGSNDSASGNAFPSRVYRFDLVAETITNVFTHPEDPDIGGETKPSIAVYGNNERILFSTYHNVAPTGNIYSSTDGTSWSLLAHINDDAEILNMVTDRTTKKVYISVGLRPSFGPGIYVYDGAVVTLDDGIPQAWEGSPSIGVQYSGNTRVYLWAVNTFSTPAFKEARFRDDTAWSDDPFDITDIVVEYEGTTQHMASIGGKMLYLKQEIFGTPRRNIVLLRDPILGWQESNAFPYTFQEHNRHYHVEYCMCRAGTSVLPHEQ